MAVSHRKLLTDSIYVETLFCKPFCDPTQNPEGLCPFSCFSICVSNCCKKILYQIPPPPPELLSPPVHHSKIFAPLIIFLFILVTLFSLFFCFTICKCFIAWYSFRSRQRSSPLTDLEETHDEFLDEDHGPVLDHPIWYIRTIGLQPSVISAITICKYKRGEGLVEGTECSVCLNEFQEDETLRLLPKCNHAFHVPCIDTWLRSHTNCPLCRAGIVSNIAGLPTPEQSIDNSNVLEDTQVGILVNNGENGREIEEGTSELRVCVEEEGIENGIKSNEIDKEELGNIDQSEVHEVQPMRRSVSVDFLSASPVEINANPIHSARNWDKRMVKANDLNMGFVPKGVDFNQRLVRLMGSSSSGTSLQKWPFLMKRSFSYSGKVLFSRHIKNSVPPS